MNYFWSTARTVLSNDLGRLYAIPASQNTTFSLLNVGGFGPTLRPLMGTVNVLQTRCFSLLYEFESVSSCATLPKMKHLSRSINILSGMSRATAMCMSRCFMSILFLVHSTWCIGTRGSDQRQFFLALRQHLTRMDSEYLRASLLEFVDFTSLVSKNDAVAVSSWLKSRSKDRWIEPLNLSPLQTFELKTHELQHASFLLVLGHRWFVSCSFAS